MKNFERDPDSLSWKDEETGLEGFVVVDQWREGLAFGGCRFSPDVSFDEVRSLAQCMSWKLLPHGLPVGGAKGGLRVDPRDPHILEKVSLFAKKAEPFFKRGLVLGKDMGASNEIMDHLYASLGREQMQVLGRGPARLRDLNGYISHMTGQGVAWAAEAGCEKSLKGQRVAIQGFGAVAAGTAYRLHQLGAQIIALNDAHRTIHNDRGLNIEWITQTSLQKAGRLPEQPPQGAQLAERDELFQTKAELLVLAAASHSVHDDQARKIEAPVVIEGSNFGLTDCAREILQMRGHTVIPDILASSSSAAMVALQMQSRNGLSPDQLWKKIEFNIKQVVRETKIISDAENRDLRGAFIDFLVPRLLNQLNQELGPPPAKEI